MAYVAPSARLTGFMVAAATWNQDVVDNVIALRAGALAIAGQAAGRVPYASSATQLATAATRAFDAATGVLSATRFAGSGASLTAIPETAIVDGAILARVGSIETISAAWTFSANTLIGSLSGAGTINPGGWSTPVLAVRASTAAVGGPAIYIGPSDVTAGLTLGYWGPGSYSIVVSSGELRFGANAVEGLRLTTNRDLAIEALKRIYLDGVGGVGDTYLVESAANTMSLVAGGLIRASVSTTLALAAGVNLTMLDSASDGGYGLSTDATFDELALNTRTGLRISALGTTAEAANVYFSGVGGTGLLLRVTSSRRWKDNITAVPLAVARRLLAADGVWFTSTIARDDPTRTHVGFLAEDLADVDESLITRDPDGQPNGVNYDRVPAFLLELVKDLYQRVEDLEKQ